jgi:hypothetical protein
MEGEAFCGQNTTVQVGASSPESAANESRKIFALLRGNFARRS